MMTGEKKKGNEQKENEKVTGIIVFKCRAQ